MDGYGWVLFESFFFLEQPLIGEHPNSTHEGCDAQSNRGDDGDLEQVSDFDQAVSMISLTNSLVAGMEHQANLRLGLQ